MRADEDGGMRGRLIKKKHYEINISLGGALPANSKENVTRNGMPNLDTMIELGPGLIIHLIKNKNTKLKLNIPIRFAISTDLTKVDDRGLVFNPLLFYIHKDFFIKKAIFFASLSVRFASRQFHKFFYQVGSEFRTPERPSYKARAGYLGTSLNLGIGHTFKKNYMSFIGVRHSYFASSANINSPLLVNKSNTSLAIGFIWWGWSSEKKGFQ